MYSDSHGPYVTVAISQLVGRVCSLSETWQPKGQYLTLDQNDNDGVVQSTHVSPEQKDARPKMLLVFSICWGSKQSVRSDLVYISQNRRVVYLTALLLWYQTTIGE